MAFASSDGISILAVGGILSMNTETGYIRLYYLNELLLNIRPNINRCVNGEICSVSIDMSQDRSIVVISAPGGYNARGNDGG